MAVVVLALLASGCGIANVDAPWSFSPDRRLEMLSPSNDEVVNLPVTIRWAAEDVDVSDGTRFAVFLNRIPLQPSQSLRMRVCSMVEQRPVVPGELRRPCSPDEESIALTTEPHHTFECIEPREFTSDRLKNVHDIRVILIGPDGRRDGTAVATVRIEVAEDEALRDCIGFTADGPPTEVTN